MGERGSSDGDGEVVPPLGSCCRVRGSRTAGRMSMFSQPHDV